jgi:tRNA pseudouridine55 synthase
MGRKRKRSKEQLDGLLVLRKPKGPTSADCLADIKHQLKQFKIGHAGTLDPMAEGVLLVLLGQGTKLATYLTGRTKTYYGELKLGERTDTYDAEGEVLERRPVECTPDELRDAIFSWKDLTEQDVPAYSAAKHKGKPLYSLARAGEDVPLKVKDITVFESEPLDVAETTASFRVRCSAGTYIRSLVHSLGMRLGCGAVLTKLVREESSPFRIEDSVGLDDVLADPQGFPARVIPMADALPHWPRIRLTEPLAELVRNGAWLPTGGESGSVLAGSVGRRALFEDRDGKALALVEVAERDGKPAWSILRGLWESPSGGS